MPDRKTILKTAIAAVLASKASNSFAKAVTDASLPSLDVLAGACDCHAHIHGDPAKFPWNPTRVYTPETAFPEEMSAVHRAIGIQRVVIVTPSVYGSDNSATLWGIAARGGDARGWRLSTRPLHKQNWTG